MTRPDYEQLLLRIEALEKVVASQKAQIKALQQAVSMLDSRTTGSIRLGGSS